MHDLSERRWPYLSPARPGWDWLGGYRGEVRRVLVRALAVRAQAGGPSGEPPVVGDPAQRVLETLHELDQLVRRIEAEVLLLVTEAHYRGATWGEIARRLDRTKQSVHQRYQRQVHARRTHEMLRADLGRADRWASELTRRRLSQVETRELWSFLRERGRWTGHPPAAGKHPAGNALTG
jgi:hypothetical protein